MCFSTPRTRSEQRAPEPPDGPSLWKDHRFRCREPQGDGKGGRSWCCQWQSARACLGWRGYAPAGGRQARADLSRDKSAKGDAMTEKPPMSDAKISGMVATVALIVMFALVGLFVWMGS